MPQLNPVNFKTLYLVTSPTSLVLSYINIMLLVNVYRPVVTSPIYSTPQDDPMTNLNTAFDVAEKHLDIPRMLDAEGKLVVPMTSMVFLI